MYKTIAIKEETKDKKSELSDQLVRAKKHRQRQEEWLIGHGWFKMVGGWWFWW